MFKRTKANFFTGLLITIPLILTVWVFYFIINKLNLWLLEPIMNILTIWLPGQNIEFLTKIAIFFVLVFLLILIGLATRIIILRNIFGFGEKILYKVPMISTVYGGLKQISEAFLLQKGSIFKRVVLVEYPRKGIYSIGFVTSEEMPEAGEKVKNKLIVVFFPTTPSPTSGIYALVPEQDIISLDMSIADGIKMVISGGAVVPKVNYGDREDRSSAPKEKGF